MMKVGFVGWRGMVGSVLMQRMREEGDFRHLDPVFFSTSQVGQDGPTINGVTYPLHNAFDLAALKSLDCVVTCQGGDYTSQVYRALRGEGWSGYWIDAASTLRMEPDAILLLDPINRSVIDRGIEEGVKTFVGANCTVSLMLMAIGGLFREGLVEWVSSMTYQAASGAGAAVMEELMRQHEFLLALERQSFARGEGALGAEEAIRMGIASADFPSAHIGVPLAYNVLPFIDKMVDGGQSREEWKGEVETNKILGTKLDGHGQRIPVDGICVRVGALRCHSQGLTIKLKREVSLQEVERLISTAHQWVRVVPNDRGETLKRLTPMAVSGSLDIAVGRIRQLKMGPSYLGLFTVGDQLLWGAAEPLRRFLRIISQK